MKMPLKEKLLQELHKLCGYCGHCGKHDCAGKQSHSTLPKQLGTDKVLAAIEETFNKES